MREQRDLAKQLVEGAGSYWSLDDESVRAAARLDPHGFVEQGSSPMAIDEVQRGGNDVVLAVKSIVDRRNDRGQFVLAASTRFLSVRSCQNHWPVAPRSWICGRCRRVSWWGCARRSSTCC